MSLSVSGANISSRNTLIPSRALTAVATGATAYGGSGRGGDTFQCSTCGGSKVAPTLRSPVSAASTGIRISNPGAAHTFGNYCPTCAAMPARSAADRAGAVYFHGPQAGAR